MALLSRTSVLRLRSVAAAFNRIDCREMIFGQRRFSGRVRSFALASALGMLMATHISAHGAKIVSNEKLDNMLAAISKIRSARDIKLDCLEFVYPHLGQSDRVGYYADLFSKAGISPTTVRHGKSYHIGFEIPPSYLRKNPNYKFGARDSIFVVFVSDNDKPDGAIHSCSSVLRAAPDYL